jgi:hypothetical protein
LQRKEEADDGGHEHSGSERIEPLDALGKSVIVLDLAVGVGEEYGDDDERDGADWQVDVETPTPCNLVGKGAAKQWPRDRGNTCIMSDGPR